MRVKWYLDIDRENINYGFISRKTNKQVFVYGVKKIGRVTEKGRVLNTIPVKNECAGGASKKICLIIKFIF